MRVLVYIELPVWALGAVKLHPHHGLSLTFVFNCLGFVVPTCIPDGFSTGPGKSSSVLHHSRGLANDVFLTPL